MNQPKPATAHTVEAHRRASGSLPFGDRTDFERASRNRLAALEPPTVTGDLGRPLIDLTNYAFLDGDCPPEVHPSLWRQAQLNCIHGLFEVVDGIYQVRGYDISNITFVRGTRGWIVIDPLTVAETAAAARALVDQHFGPRPITAVIYTHSHIETPQGSPRRRCHPCRRCRTRNIQARPPSRWCRTPSTPGSRRRSRTPRPSRRPPCSDRRRGS